MMFGGWDQLQEAQRKPTGWTFPVAVEMAADPHRNNNDSLLISCVSVVFNGVARLLARVQRLCEAAGLRERIFPSTPSSSLHRTGSSVVSQRRDQPHFRPHVHIYTHLLLPELIILLINLWFVFHCYVTLHPHRPPYKRWLRSSSCVIRSWKVFAYLVQRIHGGHSPSHFKPFCSHQNAPAEALRLSSRCLRGPTEGWLLIPSFLHPSLHWKKTSAVSRHPSAERET